MPLFAITRLFRAAAPARKAVPAPIVEGVVVSFSPQMSMPTYVSEDCNDVYHRVRISHSAGQIGEYVVFPDEFKQTLKTGARVAFSPRKLPGADYGASHAIDGPTLRITA